MNQFHHDDIMYVTSVTLKVKDIKTMLAFYMNVLKMKLIYKMGRTYSLGTESDRVLVVLVADENALLKRQRTTGLYHFALLLPTRHDLGVFLNYYLAGEHPLSGASDHAVSEALYLNDPEGNGIEIYCDRPSSAWRFNEDGVVMTTEALDHVSLLKEKGKYDKIPDDTVMGHLHLHVNNIDEAKAFFVDTLGFNKMLDYGPSASFISDGQYHHHLAYNTWLGTTNRHRSDDETGLMAYEVNVPARRMGNLVDKLKHAGVEYVRGDGEVTFKDINHVTVRLVLVTS
ncbi:MAG: VOC family protein [Bacilli bacterium]